ncbi:MAG: hypothetical protein ACYCW6_32550, partial [Candidatus Xenobia bacterium]
ADGVLEFGPTPPGDPLEELRVARLTDPSSGDNLADTSPLLDPVDCSVPPPETPSSQTLSAYDLIGWWAVPLPHRSSPPGQRCPIDRVLHLSGHDLAFDTLISDDAGGLLRCVGHVRPRVLLQGAQRYVSELSGPWGPEQNRYYARFDPVAEPVEVLLEGLLGVPLPEPTSYTFSPRRHFEIADWHLASPLGIGELQGSVLIDVVVRESGSFFVCPRIEIAGGDVEHATVSGATITSAAGHTYESEGESTAWVEAEQTYRSGLSFPPVHEVGEEVTLTVHTVDVTLRTPLTLASAPG